MAELILTIPGSPAGRRAVEHLYSRATELGGEYLGSLNDAVPGLAAATFLAELPFTLHLVAAEDGQEAAVANRILAWHSGERREYPHGRVDAVELNVPLYPLAALGLPFRPAHNHAGYLTAMGVPAAHAIGVRGAGVRVAVLDSGLDPTTGCAIRDFYDVENTARLHPGPLASVDGDGHGTAMAQLVRDVAPDAELYVVRVLDTGRLNLWKLLAGVGVAIADCEADVVNLSLGFSTLLSCGVCGGPAAVRSLAFEKLTDAATPRAGKLPVYVAAVGNSAATTGFEFPASSTKCMAVGSVDGASVRSAFSSYGTAHARYLMAPGGQQRAAGAGGVAGAFTEDVGTSGTGTACAGSSVATAYVSGMLALFRSEPRYSGLARDAFVDAVLHGHCVLPPHAAGNALEYGHGVIQYAVLASGGAGGSGAGSATAGPAPDADADAARHAGVWSDGRYVYIGGVRLEISRHDPNRGEVF